MSTTFLVSLLAALAVAPSHVAADFSDFVGCTALDHETFYASAAADKTPVFGPNGFYLPDGESGCLFVDATTPEFASAHPELHTGYTNALANITSVTAELGITPFKQSAKLFEKRAAAATPGCGQICTDSCLSPCVCRDDQIYCQGGVDGCFVIRRCKG